MLLHLNKLDNIDLVAGGIGDWLCRKTPTYEAVLKEYGAFNSFQDYVGQTPVDIAGDLRKSKCVKTMISHFLQEEHQQTILRAFLEPGNFEQYGVNRIEFQPTKLRGNWASELDAREMLINFTSSKEMNKI